MNLDTKSDGQPVKGTLSMDRSGHCDGTLTTASQGGFQILKSGKSIWIKPDSAMLTKIAGTQAAKLLAGKHLDVSGKSDMKDMADFRDLNSFLKQIGGDNSGNDHVSKDATAMVDGVKTVVLKGRDDTDGTPMYIYIATMGTPYPLKVVHPTGKNSGTVAFSDYGAPVRVQAPSPELVIDPSKLQG